MSSHVVVTRLFNNLGSRLKRIWKRTPRLHNDIYPSDRSISNEMSELSTSLSWRNVLKRYCHGSLRSYFLFTIIAIVSFLLINTSSPIWLKQQPIKYVKYNLKIQNMSVFNFVRFRNLVQLTKTCESMSTIDCLSYLHNKQSDYVEPLSPDELRIFKDNYCTGERKMLFHSFGVMAFDWIMTSFVYISIHSYIHKIDNVLVLLYGLCLQWTHKFSMHTICSMNPKWNFDL